MRFGISLGINVKMIEKSRLQANGDKIWLNATVYFDPDNPDQYGQHGMIIQDVSKQEKEDGVKGNILGNCKMFWSDQGREQGQQNQGGSNNQDNDPEIPF